MERPALDDIDDAAEFLDWYWLKEELADYCRRAGLPVSGAKADLRARIRHFLETGETLATPAGLRRAPSKTKWSKATLTPETIIDESISFGPNVRGFFTQQIGAGFSCTSEFMAWVKSNPGRTLADAVDHWQALEARKSDPAFRREIAPDNQYNRYVRAFFDDNPDADMKTARACWLAKSRRRGRPVYARSDLGLIEGD